MSVVDLHPEDLLDKEIDGDLTRDERARLDAHLRGCAACNFERGSRAAFKEDFESLGRSLQRKGMVTLAMKAGQPQRESRPAREAGLAVRHRRLRPLLLIAAAFLLLATGAAAAKWSEGKLPFLSRSSPPQSEGAGEVRAVHGGKAKLGGPVQKAVAVRADDAPEIRFPEAVAPVSPPAPVETAAAPVVPPAAERPREAVGLAVVPPSSAIPPPARSSIRQKAVTLPPSAGTGAVAPSGAAVVATTSPPLVLAVNPPPSSRPYERTAAALFDEANEARREGSYDRAITLYREFEGHFVSAPEAKSAEAILGRLFLDRGDAGEALVRFDSYLARGGGALREEALVGRAKALRQMGRVARERDAWGDLLSEFPRSVHADEARARMATLGAR